MAGPNDFTNQNIQDTYQRVLQTDGQNIFDGTGSAFNLTNNISITASHAQQAVTASHALFAISASHEITYELSSSYAQTADSASDDFHIANDLHFTGLTSEITSNGATQFTFQPTNGQILAATNIRTQDGKGIKFGVDSDYTIQHNSTATGDTKLAIKEGNTTRYTYGIGGHLTGSSNVNLKLGNGGEFRGDSANINNITASTVSASAYVLTGELRGGGDEVSLNILGSVTASGNISASGVMISNKYEFGEGGSNAYLLKSGESNLTVKFENSNFSGHITASGNISSSGNISALTGTGSFLSADISSTLDSTSTTSQAALRVAGGLSVAKKTYTKHLVVAQDFAVGNNVILCDNIADSIMMIGTVITDINQTGDLNQTGNIFTSGHISASGDISSSGVLYVNHISTGSGELAENYISITGSTSVFGSITASGNISSSGNGHFANLQVPAAGKIRFDDVMGSDDQYIQGNENNITVDGDQFVKLIANDSIEVGISTNDIKLTIDTSEGHISASGNVYASRHYVDNWIALDSTGTTGTLYGHNGLTDIHIGKNDGVIKNIKASGHITASGNISATDFSASGVVYTNHISTGSGELAENYISITGSTSVFGNITASGNISSSGNIIVSNVYMPGGSRISFDDALDGTDQYIYGEESQITIESDNYLNVNSDISVNLNTPLVLAAGIISGSSLFVTSHISASGNITATDLSASGVVYTNHISTGSGELSENYISITGSTSVFGNITASANISASGHIITHTLRGNTSGDQSGSLTLGGSLTFNENVAEPAVSASTLFAKRSGSNNATDSDLRFSNSGLTPSFGFFSMDGDGTDDSNENPFGKGGGSVTSTTHNMIHTFVDGSEGVRAYIQLGGIYKIHGALICESSAVIAEVEISIRKDGSDVFATRMEVHSSVDPVERSFLGVTTAESGSYFDVTLGTPTSTGNINMKAGSTLMIERLA
jgi:hypothetical protein